MKSLITAILAALSLTCSAYDPQLLVLNANGSSHHTNHPFIQVTPYSINPVEHYTVISNNVVVSTNGYFLLVYEPATITYIGYHSNYPTRTVTHNVTRSTPPIFSLASGTYAPTNLTITTTETLYDTSRRGSLRYRINGGEWIDSTNQVVSLPLESSCTIESYTVATYIRVTTEWGHQIQSYLNGEIVNRTYAVEQDMSITVSPNIVTMTVSWASDNAADIYESADVRGPWTFYGSFASSPASLPTTNSMGFYKVVLK